MRKLAAILLLGIFLFNWVGYRALHGYLRDQATRQLEAKLDEQPVDPSQLISLKVPSNHLSYYNSSDVFVRVNGQIEVDGVPYEYVARRLFNDSAEYLCIKNTAVLSLRAGRDAFYSMVNDLRSPVKDSQGARNHHTEDFFGDPYVVPVSNSFDNPGFKHITRESLYIVSLPAGNRASDDRPPAVKA